MVAAQTSLTIQRRAHPDSSSVCVYVCAFWQSEVDHRSRSSSDVHLSFWDRVSKIWILLRRQGCLASKAQESTCLKWMSPHQGLNSGPPACRASTLPTGPSSHLLSFSICHLAIWLAGRLPLTACCLPMALRCHVLESLRRGYVNHEELRTCWRKDRKSKDWNSPKQMFFPRNDLMSCSWFVSRETPIPRAWLESKAEHLAWPSDSQNPSEIPHNSTHRKKTLYFMERPESIGIIFISLKSHCPWRPVLFIHPLDLKLSQGSLWQNGGFREPVTGCGANQGRMSEASEKLDRDLVSGSRIQSGTWASEMSPVSGLKGSVYSWKNYRSIWCWVTGKVGSSVLKAWHQNCSGWYVFCLELSSCHCHLLTSYIL